MQKITKRKNHNTGVDFFGWNKVGIYENGKVIIDDGATAKKRKGWQDSHAFITSQCFAHYHPQIIDFITRRMQ